MESEGNNWNWTEAVEDLVHEGEIDKAISLLGKVITKKRMPEKASELATAFVDLSKLYSTQGFSLKADQTRTRALQINQES